MSPIPELNPVSCNPCNTHTHTDLTCTHRSQDHFAQPLLRCKWFVSMHHWPNSAPSPPLSSTHSFLTLSITTPPQALRSPCTFVSVPSSSSSSPTTCLFVLCSSYFPFFWLPICFLSPPSALWPSLAHLDEWVILLHCAQPSLSMFHNGSFDSFPLVFSIWQSPRAGSHAVIIKSMSTVKPQCLQVIKTLQLRVTSSQSLVFSCPTFWLLNPQSVPLPTR